MSQAPLSNILFLDIETVSQHASFEELPAHWQQLWDEKTRYQRQEVEAAEYYPQRAAILAEFGQVVCISCGFFTESAAGLTLRVKSFYGKNEKELLQNFAHLLSQNCPGFLLCAHNGKEFDFPYLSRRMLVHGIALPPQLNTSGAKPWEVPHLDTLELWKFGDRKNFTSLKLLAALFDIPTPKDDIDGSQVGRVFWEEDDLPRIKTYCEKDTVTLAKVYLKMTGRDDQMNFEMAKIDE
jgi:DNA polymerase elongation subunit (family B)